ncbi:MAG: SGNH/GDSL hydrolase family protein [Gammaproteobacteria bacterium]|nr:SGNH/GDSL hydrolase family protein [Gammaproteobacteria bacterium]NNC96965.1 SGNH/GDSL hydrolase family protein [Gammaproteobacteria bacterium]NNM13410.1 SGNH/GDSL hydrolase family protein [Gammaproteobacteria bacterium]
MSTRRKALRLPEPTGDRIGTAGTGKPFRLLVLGDSAAAGVGVSHQSQALSGQLAKSLSTDFCVEWQLIAQSGRTTLDTLHLLCDEPQQNKFDVVLISLGVNDVTSLVRRKTWIQHCRSLSREIQKVYSPKSIVWSDLPEMGKFTAMPQPLRWLIGKRKDHMRQSLAHWIAQEPAVSLLEFPDVFSQSEENIQDWIASDGFHPGEKVYALWGKLAADKIRDLAVV